MEQYNFPTVILSGVGSLEEFCKRLLDLKPGKILIVSDQVLKNIGIVEQVTTLLEQHSLEYALFCEAHSNPSEDDVLNGSEVYNDNRKRP